MYSTTRTTITHEDDGRVPEEQPLDQQMMIEYKETTIRSEDAVSVQQEQPFMPENDSKVQEEQPLRHSMMIENKRNNH